MDFNEKEAAQELRSLGFKSSWACKDGVFLDSADAFRLVRMLKKLVTWCYPMTKRTSLNEVMEILRVGLNKRELWRKDNIEPKDNQSGKGAYSSEETKPLDLG